MLRDEPDAAHLFQFIADAPTVTMQRLKGMTSGSLPTFVDVGDNFGASEIVEDNWLFQFAAQNKSLVFMGDDTWMGLFPSQFREAWPFPSFNVFDLHSVDNGVLEHLLPTIVNDTNWDGVIAHFLGVDHVGHRFQADHPAMTAKLDQMDAMLGDVLAAVDDDTLLVVLGDHGTIFEQVYMSPGSSFDGPTPRHSPIRL